jgi:hypothetical protein
LVLSKDPDLRSSICFLLETEGYSVQAPSVFPLPAPIPACDCIVADHHAWTRREMAMAIAPQLVLLVNRSDDHIVPPNARTVVKPLLGYELVQVVRQLLGSAAAPTGNPVGG